MTFHRRPGIPDPSGIPDPAADIPDPAAANQPPEVDTPEQPPADDDRDDNERAAT